MMMAALLQLDRICRAFPGVQALREVSFSIEAGTLHALIGENGAGKSTLIKILAGALAADSGTLWLNGQRYQPHDPRQALRSGLATIHQELNLLPTRSVLANLMLGQEPTRYGFLDRALARAAARRVLQQLHAEHLPLDAPLDELTLGEKQLVAIGKALLSECRLLIMDEPTAALNSAEVEALFNVLAALKARGVTLLYVSHRLDEIFRIADTVTVLRDGQHVRTTPLRAATPDDLIADMLGRSLINAFPPRHPATGEGVLSVEHLSSGRAFEDVSFQLHRGEVLAVTGLAGSGKTELGRALFGAWPIDRGRVRWFEALQPLTPPGVVALGVGYVPEDRQAEGLLLEATVRRNITLTILPRLARWLGLLDRSGERRTAQRQAEALQLKAPSLAAPAHVLSGGNQQKTVLAKWLAAGARALILSEPTQGIDVGVKFEIYHLIAQLARSGTAILLISSELPEVLGLAQRVLVMRGGKIVADLPGAETQAADILRAATGV
ncbi:MAG TPA: sugar ABC transporter ATP-binding protein [Anaerolineae bacterium]|nr:sugar ABC transporter ATP-binding protein [Anaerolineae bacterium]